MASSPTRKLRKRVIEYYPFTQDPRPTTDLGRELDTSEPENVVLKLIQLCNGDNQLLKKLKGVITGSFLDLPYEYQQAPAIRALYDSNQQIKDEFREMAEEYPKYMIGIANVTTEKGLMAGSNLAAILSEDTDVLDVNVYISSAWGRIVELKTFLDIASARDQVVRLATRDKAYIFDEVNGQDGYPVITEVSLKNISDSTPRNLVIEIVGAFKALERDQRDYFATQSIVNEISTALGIDLDELDQTSSANYTLGSGSPPSTGETLKDSKGNEVPPPNEMIRIIWELVDKSLTKMRSYRNSLDQTYWDEILRYLRGGMMFQPPQNQAKRWGEFMVSRYSMLASQFPKNYSTYRDDFRAWITLFYNSGVEGNKHILNSLSNEQLIALYESFTEDSMSNAGRGATNAINETGNTLQWSYPSNLVPTGEEFMSDGHVSRVYDAFAGLELQPITDPSGVITGFITPDGQSYGERDIRDWRDIKISTAATTSGQNVPSKKVDFSAGTKPGDPSPGPLDFGNIQIPQQPGTGFSPSGQGATGGPKFGTGAGANPNADLAEVMKGLIENLGKLGDTGDLDEKSQYYYEQKWGLSTGGDLSDIFKRSIDQAGGDILLVALVNLTGATVAKLQLTYWKSETTLPPKHQPTSNLVGQVVMSFLWNYLSVANNNQMTRKDLTRYHNDIPLIGTFATYTSRASENLYVLLQIVLPTVAALLSAIAIVNLDNASTIGLVSQASNIMQKAMVMLNKIDVLPSIPVNMQAAKRYDARFDPDLPALPDLTKIREDQQDISNATILGVIADAGGVDSILSTPTTKTAKVLGWLSGYLIGTNRGYKSSSPNLVNLSFAMFNKLWESSQSIQIWCFYKSQEAVDPPILNMAGATAAQRTFKTFLDGIKGTYKDAVIKANIVNNALITVYQQGRDPGYKYSLARNLLSSLDGYIADVGRRMLSEDGTTITAFIRDVMKENVDLKFIMVKHFAAEYKKFQVAHNAAINLLVKESGGSKSTSSLSAGNFPRIAWIVITYLMETGKLKGYIMPNAVKAAFSNEQKTTWRAIIRVIAAGQYDFTEILRTLASKADGTTKPNYENFRAMKPEEIDVDNLPAMVMVQDDNKKSELDKKIAEEKTKIENEINLKKQRDDYFAQILSQAGQPGVPPPPPPSSGGATPAGNPFGGFA